MVFGDSTLETLRSRANAALDITITNAATKFTLPPHNDATSLAMLPNRPYVNAHENKKVLTLTSIYEAR
jgi:hypothetical protein